MSVCPMSTKRNGPLKSQKDRIRRIVMRLTASGLNTLQLGGEEELLVGQNLYLESVNVVGVNFPTAMELVVQPVRNGFEFDDINVSGNMVIKKNALYVALDGANTLRTYEPPLLIDVQSKKVLQQQQFLVADQDGNAPTFTSIFMHFLIKPQ